MYRPIKMNQQTKSSIQQKLDQFDLNPLGSSSITEEVENINKYSNQYFSEAVFKDGKHKLDKILVYITKLHDELHVQIDNQNKLGDDSKDFDPKAYWKNPTWKELEDEIKSVFGFRICTIEPTDEKYSSRTKKFEYNDINCAVYHADRFPIEGLITDDGFYDKSNSLTMNIYITLGLMYNLEPDEILGVILHEFGHGIDPALVTIEYTGTNILTKYITDRKGALTKAEQKMINNKTTKHNLLITTFDCLVVVGLTFGIIITSLINSIRNYIEFDKNSEEKLIKKIKQEMKKDKNEFNRYNYSEAFADNFARMYGYAVPCMKGLKKADIQLDDMMHSRIEKESQRRKFIYNMTIDALKDCHKTEVHRIYALIKEYDADIKDPNTPDTVKKQLQADRDELQLVLDSYMNDFDKFQNNINKMIYEELVDEDIKREIKNDVKTESYYNESMNMNNKHKRRSALPVSKLNTKRQDFLKIFKTKEMKKSPLKDDNIDIKNKHLEENIEKVLNDIFNETKHKSIRLEPGKCYKSDDISKRTSTKIGGIPYWPKNKKYPVSSTGDDYVCIAQLNFSELPKLEGFPSSGIMQFFIPNIYDTICGNDECKIIYHKTIVSEDNMEMNIPSLIDDNLDVDFPISGVYYPTAKIEEVGINMSEADYDEYLLKYLNKYLNTEYTKWNDIPKNITDIIFKKSNAICGCRIEGHPYFTQYDIRKENHNREIMLLQLDSEENMMWGDCGIAHFFTSKEALKSCKFDNNVTFYWDCY